VDVTVCVVTYNHEKYIEKCLESILNQNTNYSFHVVVGDDLSQDNTRNILDKIKYKYKEKLIVIKNDKNIGSRLNAINVLGKVNSKYICMVDGDDYWDCNKLQKQVDFLEKNTSCSAVYTNAYIVSPNDDFFAIFNNKQPEIFNQSYLIRFGNFLNHSSIMYRAKYLGNIVCLENLLDYSIHLTLANYGTIGYINELLSYYRINVSGSLTKDYTSIVHEKYWDVIKNGNFINVNLFDRISSICDFFSRILMAFILTRKKTYPKLILIYYKKFSFFHKFLISIMFIPFFIIKIVTTVKKYINKYFLNKRILFIR
jgi:glycosyltransferase involved in cell wall biosynthesis